MFPLVLAAAAQGQPWWDETPGGGGKEEPEGARPSPWGSGCGLLR
jgi:hypothetical protein